MIAGNLKRIALLGLVLLHASDIGAGTYTTSFPLTENPISEGGNWTNGKTDGLDWCDVSTVPGLAFGTQTGVSGEYDDSTAILKGDWGPNQTVTATVYTVNQTYSNVYEEVELRLRSSISANSNSGYEVLFRCRNDSSSYVEIVRWNGPLGSFTSLAKATGSSYGISSGDVVKATVSGNVITAYKNDVQLLQASDNTYGTGNPGIGFWLRGTTGVNGDYGFTTFSATDSEDPRTPSSPSNLQIFSAP